MSFAFKLSEVHASALRLAMRHMADGVGIIRAGLGPDRTRLAATACAGLSSDPLVSGHARFAALTLNGTMP